MVKPYTITMLAMGFQSSPGFYAAEQNMSEKWQGWFPHLHCKQKLYKLWLWTTSLWWNFSRSFTGKKNILYVTIFIWCPEYLASFKKYFFSVATHIIFSIWIKHDFLNLIKIGRYYCEISLMSPNKLCSWQIYTLFTTTFQRKNY